MDKAAEKKSSKTKADRGDDLEISAYRPDRPSAGRIVRRTAIQEQSICWFVQKDKHIQIEKKGLPDYLEFKEEQVMLF
ncbi:hypothetical protein E5329_02405 [Petralouisia muris]|uniref:Uncharacterized protein n=1 Tax=Petralouisia muris TaxID=3032872 RepID=A0AC61S0N3_9FIRM|nr:hypothetical protein E5329_02405 [Petralouisia muris]